MIDLICLVVIRRKIQFKWKMVISIGIRMMKINKKKEVKKKEILIWSILILISREEKW